MRKKSLSRYANTRMGWHQHYADVFNKTGRETAAHLACWYLLLHEAFGE